MKAFVAHPNNTQDDFKPKVFHPQKRQDIENSENCIIIQFSKNKSHKKKKEIHDNEQ
jgi:hypothetical protein